MKHKIIILLIINLILKINLINSESQKSILQLPGIIFDQFPDYNDNFQVDVGQLTKNLVVSTINKVTRSPDIASISMTKQNIDGRIKSPNLFKYFFNPNKIKDPLKNSGANFPITYILNLTLDNQSNYTYENPKIKSQAFPFYPIDYQGFDIESEKRKYLDSDVEYRNFHFCIKFNLAFLYKGFERFFFQGDDDHWVFIDDKLVRDCGGLQTRTPDDAGTIDLTKLGLQVGKVYKFDYFHCERRTPDSKLKIKTNIDFFCTGIDYCGVCGGSGEICCNALDHCNDGNWCTDDFCPTPDTKIDDLKRISEYCIHKPKVDPGYVDNKCKISKCNSANESFDVTDTVCPSKSSQCLQFDSCDPQIGCQYSSICNGVCDVSGKCNSNGTCATKTSNECGKEIDGKESDLCFDYYCDPFNGCSKRPKCPQKNNTCVRDYCDPVNGACLSENIGVGNCDCDCPQVDGNKCRLKVCSNTSCFIEIDTNDYNNCTKDSCDPATGLITHIVNVTCSGGCNRCNPKTGQCELFHGSCQDDNPCTESVCSFDGKCKSTPTNCTLEDNDLCKDYKCDEIKGCVVVEKDCSDFATNKCEEGYCNSKLGCQVRPKVCQQSEYFCLSTECDEKFGCITYDKRCSPDNGRCQKGVCNNETKSCQSIDYDPKPFICKTAVVVSTAVVAGVVVAGAVFLGFSVFGGKKAYDYYKSNKNNVMGGLKENPFYETPKINTENPLYKNKSILYMSMSKLGKLFSSKDLSKSPPQQPPLA